MGRKAFEGVKIAEFSWFIAGPASSKYLADHGATVVKVESHTRVDPQRTLSPLVGGEPTGDNSVTYGRHNANKYSVTLDLKHPNGQKLALKLIMWADIVTENFAPGVMERWGLDYKSVRKLRSDIIYFSSSLQGRGGPHADFAGYGSHASALIGFEEVCGWPDRMPTLPYGAYTDFVCPRFNAAALIAALEYRRRTGKGQWIEQSQCETSLHFFSPPVMDYLVNGRVARRDGNRLPHATPHGIFPCKGDDRWIAIAVFTDKEWRSFCNAIGNMEWTKKTEFTTLSKRKENEDELEKLVGEWTVNYTAEHVEGILQAAGVAANIVAKPSDLFEDPQLKHRNFFARLEHPVVGRQAFEHQESFILSKTPREITMPPPCLGEHNVYVFKELLGMTDDEIANHIVDGSITTKLPGGLKFIM